MNQRDVFEQLKAEIEEKRAKAMSALQTLFPEFFDSAPAATLKVSLEQKMCALCLNPVRSDNGGCPKCGRKVCRDHKAPSGSSRSGFCVKCASTLPDGRSANGGARPNSGPAPKDPVPKKRGRPRKGFVDIRPDAGTVCESCTKGTAVVKCAGCAKMICGKCAQWNNGQCQECVKAPV